jgi:SAM-dependent methyltransferase
MSRPELTGHASLFYNEKEARKYNSSSRMVNVQREITHRAIELLLLPQDQTSFVLDIGCGSGLSGEVLEEQGHVWVGCDVSRDMLQVAHERMAESFEEKDGGMDDDDDDDDDDDGKPPSKGDMLHHVSTLHFSFLNFCFSAFPYIFFLGYGNRIAVPPCNL